VTMGQAIDRSLALPISKKLAAPAMRRALWAVTFSKITTTQEITMLVAHGTVFGHRGMVNLFSFVSALDQSRLRRGATVVHAKTSLKTSATHLGLTTPP
jgi:hypothetical protein